MGYQFFRESPRAVLEPWGHADTAAYIEKLYESCCDISESVTMAAENELEPILEDFVRQMHAGKLSGQRIHYSLYMQTADRIMSAVLSAFNTGDLSYDSADNTLINYIRRNIFAFSAAKNFAQQRALADLLIDASGKIKSFSQFKKDASTVLDSYNKNWLRAEYNNAVATAQMAAKWNDFVSSQEETPYLEYTTVHDERVRQSHRALDGTTLPVNSPVWDTIYPPNDWNCRCSVIPGVASKATGDPAEVGRKGKAIVPDYFQNNVGKTGIVFKEENGAHPYFLNVRGKIDNLDPVKNYNLTIPKPDKLPGMRIQETENDYRTWWDGMVEKHGTTGNSFALRDVLGQEILFEAPANGINNKLFRDHVILKTVEKRHRYINNLEDILKSPDEVYSRYNKEGTLDTVYIKYFKEGPLMLIVNNDRKAMRAVTMFMYERRHLGVYASKRKGVLIYSKK